MSDPAKGLVKMSKDGVVLIWNKEHGMINVDCSRMYTVRNIRSLIRHAVALDRKRRK